MSQPTQPYQIYSTITKRFRPEKAENYSAVVHFDLSGDYPVQFSVKIMAGDCTVKGGLLGIATFVVSAKSQHYVALEMGEMNPQLAILTGKVKVSNINEMLRFSKCFYPYKKFMEKGMDKPPLKSRKPDSGPLLGFRILDLTRLLPGPWATALLADMGAEVIKVEDPDAPDYVRDYPPIKGGKSVNYMAWNRSKRSLALSVRSEEGRRKFLELVKTVDVVVEQFRPGVVAEWGIGYEAAKAVNPKIVYVSLTGYGQTGPMAQAAGHDLNYLALSGILSQNKDDRGKPVIPGVQLADIASGTYQTVQAVLAALLSRTQTGQGQQVDISMTDGLLPLATIAMNQYWAEGTVQPNGQSPLSGQLPNYNVYETADGKWMALGALEPKFWSRFCVVTGNPQWTEKAIPSHPDLDKVKEEVAALFLSQPRTYWEALAMKEDICLTPVLELSELENHPHFKAREMFDYTTDLPLINQPMKFGGTPSKVQWPAPELGEDEVM